MHKQLFRSATNRVISGVCGGLAEYIDIDPVIVRVFFIVFSLGAGIGFLAYIILWIIVPQGVVIIRPSTSENMNENQEKADADETKHSNVISEEEYQSKNSRSKVTFAAIIIIIGLLWFLHNVIPWLSFSNFWPLLLIALGILIFIRAIKPTSRSDK